MNPNNCLISRRVDSQNLMARVENMIFHLTVEDVIVGVDEVRPRNESSIKSTESTHVRLIQKLHPLLCSKFCHEILNDTKWYILPSTSAEAVSRGNITEAV